MSKARVVQGRLVMDEPTDLPEGTEVEVLLFRTRQENGRWVAESADFPGLETREDTLQKALDMVQRAAGLFRRVRGDGEMHSA